MDIIEKIVRFRIVVPAISVLVCVCVCACVRVLDRLDIMSEHILCEERSENFDWQLNAEQLNKCLISLRELCIHLPLI